MSYRRIDIILLPLTQSYLSYFSKLGMSNKQRRKGDCTMHFEKTKTNGDLSYDKSILTLV